MSASSHSPSIKEEFAEELMFVEASRMKAYKARSRVWVIIFFYTLASIAIAYGMFKLAEYPLFSLVFLVVAAMGGLGIYRVSYQKHRDHFNYVYKHLIIKKLTSKIAPGIIYTPERGISESLFRDAGQYYRRVDRYYSEDLFEGKIGDTQIIFSELHAEHEKTSTDSHDNETSTWETIFKGMFFEADFHKHFKSWVTIKPDYEADNVFGWINSKIQGLNTEIIKLENPEFEKHFKVYAGNEVMARYILTPDMQERMLDLRELLGGKLVISFRNSSVYITVPKSQDWFEPSVDIPSECEKQIIAMAQQMQLYFQIVETLNLNTRIWTKV